MKLFPLVLLLIGSAGWGHTSLVERVAIEALTAAKHSPSGLTNEHGGMIYGHPSDYGPVVEYIEPTPEGSPTSVTVVNRELLGFDDVLLGTFHIHLCMPGYYHAYFSTTDVITAIFSGVPEFMLDECTGEVHEFDPHKDRVRDTGIDATICGPNGEALHRHLPSGRIIGNIHETLPEAKVSGADGC